MASHCSLVPPGLDSNTFGNPGLYSRLLRLGCLEDPSPGELQTKRRSNLKLVSNICICINMSMNISFFVISQRDIVITKPSVV